MKYTLDNIRDRYNNKEKLEYVFFWKHYQNGNIITQSCLSQWYDCKFEIDGILYSSAEQYMMAQKALLFEDVESYRQILKSKHPKDYKALGRRVTNFNGSKWNSNRCPIVIKGNLAKFSQNEKLKNYLFSTKDKILVEASPYDKIWGIALPEENKRSKDPFAWKGENLLGFALMEVRDELRRS